MSGLWSDLRHPSGRPGALAVLSVGVAVTWLSLAALVGTLVVSTEPSAQLAAQGGDRGFLAGLGTADTAPVDTGATPVAGATTTTAVGAFSSSVLSGGQTAGRMASGPASGPSATTKVTAVPKGDTTGVLPAEVKIGIHGPLTIDGVPLNLAASLVKGLQTYAQYLNDHGGVYGRKLALDIQTDDSGTAGARTAADVMINDHKDFMVSGTLGIDQVAVVAAEANKRGVPYTAAGGNEGRPVPGMYQLYSSYNSQLAQLADYMRIDPNLKSRRVGILVSDSEYIRPAADEFVRRLKANGMTVSTVVVSEKPQTNPDYNSYILQFAQANTGVVVPITDPVTTSQVVQRCAAGAACGWTYTFAGFAHDSDTALALMSPTWSSQHVRGLSPACYYQAPEVDDPAKCANMRAARDQYIAIQGQDAWNSDGSGAAFGYQIISFLKGALLAAGPNLTREGFVQAIRSFNGYRDLVSGPIGFVGGGNPMHGSTRMAVWEAQSNNKWKMVSPGLVDHF